MPARKLKSNTPSVVAEKIGSNGCGIAGHSSGRSNEAPVFILPGTLGIFLNIAGLRIEGARPQTGCHHIVALSAGGLDCIEIFSRYVRVAVAATNMPISTT
jgi:hypothetical protein